MGKGGKGKGFTLKKSSLGKISKTQKVNKKIKTNKPLLLSKVKRNLEKISSIERSKIDRKHNHIVSNIVLQESALQIFYKPVVNTIVSYDAKIVLDDVAKLQPVAKNKRLIVDPSINRFNGLNFDSDSDAETNEVVLLKSSLLEKV